MRTARRWTHIAFAMFVLAGCRADPWTQSASRSIDTTDLLGQWALDDGSGLVATDSSDQGNDGQVVGATWADGVIDGALSFDGEDDAVQIPETAELDVGQGDAITVSAWVWPRVPPVTKNNIILSKGADDFGKNYRVYLGGLGATNELSIAILYTDAVAGTHVYTASQALPAEEWHHVAVSLRIGQPDTAAAYVDGVKVDATWAVGDGTGAPQLNDDDLYIGAEANAGPGERFLGLIDDVWFFRRPLSAAEIEELYVAGVPPAADAGTGVDAAGAAPDSGEAPERQTLYGCGIGPARAFDALWVIFVLVRWPGVRRTTRRA